MNPRIIPLNLPAGLEREVAGNPASTRLEDAVANCFPGLEMDIRNLDRRFFPGLIFEFVQAGSGDLRGARLVATDSSDTATPLTNAFTNELQKLQNLIDTNVPVFLSALVDTNGKRIEMVAANGTPYDWDVTWRLVRSVERGEITVELGVRGSGKMPPVAVLTAKRREYQDEHGQLHAAYQPGELTQSLCSPWQHDFRDCSCTYWAANHPDIVLPEHPANIDEIEAAGADPAAAEEPLIWERWNQSQSVAVEPTGDSCRPFEMDHYEINSRWRDLPFVLEGRERRIPWTVSPTVEAPPLPGDKLVEALQKLAGVEHALALEYLYTRYTVRFDDQTLSAQDLASANFIAHELLMIATGEMMHLRWVNQLLYSLNRGKQHSPALHIAEKLPDTAARKKGDRLAMRAPSGRPIDEAIDDFLDAEQPDGSIESQYARVLSLLRQGLPAGKVSGPGRQADYRGPKEFSPDDIGLVERIMADGVSHYSRFREIKALLRQAGEPVVRALTQLTADTPPQQIKDDDGKTVSVTLKSFTAIYVELLKVLKEAYFSGRVEDRALVVRGRQLMLEMNSIATQLAQKNLGIPLIDVGREALREVGLA